jgi:LmbE family N-acetylglucosaminyl deacetylase
LQLRSAAEDRAIDATRHERTGCALDLLAKADRAGGRALSVLVITAHPDDETIGAGATLGALAAAGARIQLLHVTDAAPRDVALRSPVFRALSAAETAASRRDELRSAMRAGELDPEAVVATCLGVPDQEASLAMTAIAREIARYLVDARADVVLTHPYEGGHPDHDAVAFAVHAAVRLPPRAPALAEMSSYHGAHGAHAALATASFLPAGDLACVRLHHGRLDAPARARKRAMLDAFTSQADVLAAFDTVAEPLRCAPAYDFTCAPHAGTLHYERLPFGWTGERWRELARASLRELRLAS